ncbi:MAG: hypothetical protein ACYTBP_04115 [Planctomycetota bacterium]|jgi:hypothetical protein
MTKKSSPVFCLEKNLARSKAWLSLKGIAPQVYLLFRTKCQMEQVKLAGKPNKRKTDWIITNNGEITFSYKEARTKFDITSSRFVRAIDDLIDKGFIDIAKSGMGIRRMTTLYAISDRWRLYGKPRFKNLARQKASWNPGFKKKSSNVCVTETSNVYVTERMLLVLRTGQNGNVQKTAYKFRNNRWLETKIA